MTEEKQDLSNLMLLSLGEEDHTVPLPLLHPTVCDLLTYWRQNKRGQKRSGSVAWCIGKGGLSLANQGYGNDLVSKLCLWQTLESCCINPWAMGGRGSPGTPFFSYNSLILCPCAEAAWSSPRLLLGWPGAFHPALFPATPLSYRTGLPVLLRGSSAAPHLMAWAPLNSVFYSEVIAREDTAAGGKLNVFWHGWHKTSRPALCLGSCERQCCSEEMGLAGRVKTNLL